MTEPFYISRAQVWKVQGVHRRARLETGTEFDMGVHGPIKEHYRIEAQDQPLPVDYMVALTGGWMLGTLNGALEAREVRLDPGGIEAAVTGFNEIVDRVPVLTRIEVEYRLRIPGGTRDIVDWALELHQSKCPTAATLKGAVDVAWTAEIEEEES